MTGWTSTLTSPAGPETASPIVCIDSQELIIEHAQALAAAISATVETYRKDGGREQDRDLSGERPETLAVTLPHRLRRLGRVFASQRMRENVAKHD